MYFGYGQMWRFTFVPIGFVIVMATFVALCLVYAVGAAKGKRTAARYVSVTAGLFLVAVILDLLYAVLSGELDAFLVAFGWVPLIEMSVLAALCIGSMWFMATSYVSSDQGGESIARDTEG